MEGCACECRCSQKPAEGVRSPGSVVTVSCELPSVPSGDYTVVLWKSSKCSEPSAQHRLLCFDT